MSDLNGCDSSTTHQIANYEEQIKIIRQHSAAVYLQLRYDHLRFLKGDGNAAVVLSHLLNLIRMKSEHDGERELLIKNEMWFKCPCGNILQQLGMKWDKLNRVLTTLETHGLIIIDHRQGNTLWLKVNTTTLNKTKKIDQPVSGKTGNRENRGQNPGKPGTGARENRGPYTNTNNPSNNLDKTHPPQASGSVRSSILVSGKSIEESSPAQKWTRKLWMKIDTIGKLNTRHQNESDLSKWVKKIEKILTKGPKNGPIPSQTEFDYYMGKLIPLIKPDMGERYIPVIYSAAALYEKWDRVVTAIDRIEKKSFNEVQKENNGPKVETRTDTNGVTRQFFTVDIPDDNDVIN